MKNVIIIDDDQEFINLVRASCKKSNEKIVLYSALDVQKGFELALEVATDLFILDIQLPESSGFDISNALDELNEKKYR